MKTRHLAAAVTAVLTTAAAVVIAPHIAQATSPATYWVSTSGSDAAAGTGTAPFRTIQHCADVAVAGDTCLIESGTYRETVTPKNSGTSSAAQITFAGAPGAKVTVDGSDPVSGWTLDSGSVYKASITISPSVQGLQLFQGATAIPSARWPATGPDLEHPYRATAGSGSTADLNTGISTINDPNIPGTDWVGATVTLWGGFQWMAQTGTVATSTAGQITFTGGNGECSTQVPALCARPGTRYYLSGVKSALKAPGQWFYDSAAHTVYYWAPDSKAPSNVTMKQRNNAFDLSGRSWVTVRNVNIFGATVMTDASSANNTLDALTATYVSQFDTMPDPDHTQDAVAAAHLLDTGIILNGSHNTLQNSTVDWSAGNGVTVLGSYNAVVNNIIHDTDYMGTFSAGVYIRGNHLNISHNTIYDTGNSGILGAYNGDGIYHSPPLDLTYDTISYNNVFNWSTLNLDNGGIYTCCVDSLANGSLDHNWFHDAQTSEIPGKGAPYNGHGSAGIYLDAGGQDYLVAHNVTWNSGGDSFMINGYWSGRVQPEPNNIRLYNNTFGPGSPNGIRASTSWQPNLSTSFVRNNIITGKDTMTAATEDHNLESSTDPQFVSPTSADFRLKSTSPAVDAGAVLSDYPESYVGSAPDIGAYEYAGTAWTPGCAMPGCTVPFDAAHSIDDAAATATGTWTSGTNAAAYAGTTRSSSTAGSTLTFAFTGTQAQLYGLRSTSGGYGLVSIDGGTKALVDFLHLYNAGDSAMWTSPLLAQGPHTVTVEVPGLTSEYSGTAVAIDRLTYSTGSATTTVDDNGNGTYTGSWGHCTSGCGKSYGGTYYGDTFSYSQTAGDTYQYTFTGTGVAVVGPTAIYGGIATVSVDGSASSYVDWYSPTPVSGVTMYNLQGLSRGQHTITITVLGAHTLSKYGRNYVYLDDLITTP